MRYEEEIKKSEVDAFPMVSQLLPVHLLREEYESGAQGFRHKLEVLFMNLLKDFDCSNWNPNANTFVDVVVMGIASSEPLALDSSKPWPRSRRQTCNLCENVSLAC